MEEIVTEVSETPEAKPWGIWPTRQTLLENPEQGKRKKRTGITTTPIQDRHKKARLKASIAAKARKRNR